MSTWTQSLRQTITKNRDRQAKTASRTSDILWTRIPWVLFGIQWLVLIGFALTEYAHFSVTWDFSIYHQAWYLIAHGDLNPKMSMANMGPFYRNHLELLMWLLAPFYWVFPHGSFLLIVQDTATIGSEAIVWLWVRDFIRKRDITGSARHWLAGLTLVLLLWNPWFFTANDFDFHFESLGTFFVVASFYAFTRHRRWLGFVLALLTALTGNVSMTYLVAAGLTLTWCEPNERRTGLLMAIGGLIAFSASIHMGVGLDAAFGPPSKSSAVHTLHQPVPTGLVGLLVHPIALVTDVTSRPLNFYANMAPEGIIGVFSPQGLLMTALISVENNLASYSLFSEPGYFQSLPMYPFLIMGTLQMTWWIWRWRHWAGRVVAVALTLNIVGWALVWFPTLPSDFVKVDAVASSTLNAILSHVSPTTEIVTSQGIFGRFAGRRYARAFSGESSVPVYTKPVIFIISPYQGVNLSSVATELARIAYLEKNLHAQLVRHTAGIWEFRWSPPPNTTGIGFPMSSAHIPAWGVGGNTGVVDLKGPVADWHVSSQDKSGYVLDKAYWRLPLGTFRAWFKLADSGPVDVEIWNATGNKLLLQRTMPATTGIRTQSMLFDNSKFYPHHLMTGWGPFKLTPVPGPSNDQIEIRIWAAAGTVVSVYAVGITGAKVPTHRHGST